MFESLSDGVMNRVNRVEMFRCVMCNVLVTEYDND